MAQALPSTSVLGADEHFSDGESEVPAPNLQMKQRTRKHRDKWRSVLAQEVQCTTGPRSFKELASLCDEDILRLDCGFPTLGELKLSLQELHTRVARQCTCTKGATQVNVLRKEQGKQLGCPLDRGKIRYVCSTDASCDFFLEVTCNLPADKKPSWSFSKYTPHTCEWHPSDTKDAKKLRDLELEIETIQLAVENAEATLSTSATKECGVEFYKNKLENLRAQAGTITRAQKSQAFLQKHRHYSVEQLAWGLVKRIGVGENPSTSETRNYIHDVTGTSDTDRFISLVRASAISKVAQFQLVDTLQYLPEYLKCLEDRGWKVMLFTSTALEMQDKLARILLRSWEDRRKDNPDLLPMTFEQAKCQVGEMHGTYCTGWLVAPPNRYPLALIQGTNEANRSQVKLIDACHMKSTSNEGTLYTTFRVDPNRSFEGMVYQLLVDVENTSGWRSAKDGEGLFERPMLGLDGALMVPPGSVDDQAMPAREVYIGDGDKGISQVFGNSMKRCVFHRKQNFLKKFPKALKEAEAFKRCSRAANSALFRHAWDQLTITQQSWADSIPRAQWAQHVHLMASDGQHNSPETMNSKPLLPARKAKNQLASLREVVAMEERRSRGATIMAHSCQGYYPPRVQERVDKAHKYAMALPNGAFHWLDGNGKKHCRLTHPSGYISNCKLDITSHDACVVSIDCNCGHTERDGWCYCAYAIAWVGKAVPVQWVVPPRMRVEAWQKHHPSAALYTLPTREDLLVADASAIREKAGIKKGECLQAPPAVPKPRGRPRKEDFKRVDIFQARHERSQRKKAAIDMLGNAIERPQHKCSKCGGFGHHAQACAKEGYMATLCSQFENGGGSVSPRPMASLPPQPVELPPKRVAPEPVEEPVEEPVQEVAMALGAPSVESDFANFFGAKAVAAPPESVVAAPPESAAVAPPESVAVAPKCTLGNAMAYLANRSTSPLPPTQVHFVTQIWDEGTAEDQVAAVTIPDHDRVAHFLVSRGSLRALRPFLKVRGVVVNDGWCNDTVIGAYCHLITRLHVDYPNMLRVRVLKDLLMANHFKPNADPDYVEGMRSKYFKRDKGVFDYERVLIPVNEPHHTHWWLCVLDLEHHQVDCYDSSGSTYCSEKYKLGYMSRVLEWVQAICDGQHHRNLPMCKALKQSNVPKWPTTVQACDFKQRDACSCGVYTMQAALHSALGMDPARMQMDDDDATALRPKIALSIIGDKLIF